MWQSRNSALPSSEETQSKEESSGGESSENVLPTGRVVGMLEEANRRLFVASFNVSLDFFFVYIMCCFCLRNLVKAIGESPRKCWSVLMMSEFHESG